MEFDIIQYLLIIILYLGLFRFLYANEGKIEGLVFILLFVLTVFVGLKLYLTFINLVLVQLIENCIFYVLKVLKFLQMI